MGLPQISRRAFHAGVLARGGAGLFLPGTVEGQDTLLIIHTLGGKINQKTHRIRVRDWPTSSRVGESP
jgi:hypothetical protein